jgi:transmembrane sensor
MDASERRKQASEEAATWWARLRSQELAREQREEFVDWLRESPIHVAEMLRIAQVHDALDQFRGWLQINVEGPDDDDQNIIDLVPPAPSVLPHSPARKPPKHQKEVWAGLVAAGLAIIALAGLFLSTRGQTIETRRGERLEVSLSDGSVLDVDPETRIRVAFEQHVRRVILERGRALFHVAKNPARPFLVEADGATVRAVGTAFGVERQPKGVLVTVAEGKVDVYFNDTAPAPNARDQGRSDTPGRGISATLSPIRPMSVGDILLTAGQQVRLEDSGGADSVRTVDTKRELAWAKGRLVFDNETVAEAAAEFNRYNQVQLRVVDEKLAARPVSGVFDASDPDSFIAFLQTVTSVHVKRTESEIVLH